jgi:hypothetical protein
MLRFKELYELVLRQRPVSVLSISSRSATNLQSLWRIFGDFQLVCCGVSVIPSLTPQRFSDAVQGERKEPARLTT